MGIRGRSERRSRWHRNGIRTLPGALPPARPRWPGPDPVAVRDLLVGPPATAEIIGVLRHAVLLSVPSDPG